MKRKPVFYAESAYLIGLILLAVGTALTEKAGFGMSMVVAPAYILHLKISQYLPFFSFGMAEYLFQALLLLVLSLIMGRFKRGHVFSFATAVLYGLILDGMLALAAFIRAESILARMLLFVSGISVSAAGIALLFRTYLPPEAYELFVKELKEKLGAGISTVKTVYDLSSCLLGVMLSFAFFGFGNFVGVSWGTVVCAAVNGLLIDIFDRVWSAVFDFRDGLKWRSFFEG